MTEIDQSEHCHFDFEITEAIYLRFWSFCIFKGVNYKLKKILILGAWILVGPSLVLFNLIYYGLIYGNYYHLLNLFDWLIAFIPFIGSAFFLTHVFLGGKRLYQKYPQMKVHTTYDFSQDAFSMTSVSKFASTTTDINYSMITLCYETQDAFYLFLHNKSASIVDKASLTQGNLTAMRLNLQKALKRKYYLCR